MINDKKNCFLTAHHCGTDSTGGGVMEFQVPLSTGGRIVHPPPEDQYSVDPKSVVRPTVNVGVGNDWQYMGCFPNSNTGLTPYQAQGDVYKLATNATIPRAGNPTQIIGYGVVEYDKPKEWNQVQKVAEGPFAYATGGTTKWTIYYTVDTTGGDSGSAVENAADGTAIGIHSWWVLQNKWWRELGNLHLQH